MSTKSLFRIAIALLTLASATACTSRENPGSPAIAAAAGEGQVQENGPAKNILQVALGSKDHTTLVAALKAADLADVFANPGPFTVFAPTDAAFAKLPKDTVQNLLKPENKLQLQNILQYHVSVGVLKAPSFKDGESIGQVNGDSVTMGVKNGSITVNGAKIVASVQTSNGIIHVIDSVLIPPQKK